MNKRSYTPPYELTSKILDSVEQIGERLGRLKAIAVRTAVPKLRRGNRIKTIQASLEIEGNTLTVQQVTAILSGQRVLGQPREIQEVRNAFNAYEQMGNFSPCDCNDLLAAHGLLMAGLVDESGKFRSGGVGIFRGTKVTHMAPPAKRVPQLIAQLLAWLKNSQEHPLITSSVFHYELEFIHPFADGNGRIGRLWQTLILSRWQPLFSLLPIESVIRDRQKEYYAALGQSDADAAATAFIEFMLNAIAQATREITLETDQVSDQVSDQVKKIAEMLRHGPQSASELMSKLGLSHRPSFRQNYLRPALDAGIIEMTRPDKPQAKNQKYQLKRQQAE